MQHGAIHAGKTVHIIAIFFHSLQCLKPCSLGDKQQQAFVSKLGGVVEPGRSFCLHKCLLDADLHCTGKIMWEQVEFWSSPCQLKSSLRLRDSSGMGAQTHSVAARACTQAELPPNAWDRDRRGRGREEAKGWGFLNHKPATWQLDGAHLHILMHHSSTSLLPQCKTLNLFPRMLIYVKQPIWETSEWRGIKVPVTFIFFCLKHCDSICAAVCIYAYISRSQLDLHFCEYVSVCVFEHVVFGQLVLALCYTSTWQLPHCQLEW